MRAKRALLWLLLLLVIPRPREVSPVFWQKLPVARTAVVKINNQRVPPSQLRPYMRTLSFILSDRTDGLVQYEYLSVTTTPARQDKEDDDE